MQITDIRIHQPVGLLRILTDTDIEGWTLGVGPDFYLMRDSVQKYTYTEAIRVGRVLQEEDYF